MSRRRSAAPSASAALRATSLADLKRLSRNWRSAEAERQAAEAERQAAARQARAAASGHGRRMGGLLGERRTADLRDVEADRALFLRSVGEVHPVRDPGRLHLDPPAPAPVPRQRELDEQAALAATLSDEVTLEAYLLTDDGLSFRRPGIGQDVLNRLRRGHWAMQGQVDLHGCTRDEAREVLGGYIRESHRRGMRCVRVIHGKGLGSPGRQPVLKDRVKRWLAQCQEVIAFAQANGPQGGEGALVVLLAGH